jgi:L,D-peptidoglycan transpeptidase YkuD (ErfK/YbiS/YcfS/YnhG family)
MKILFSTLILIAIPFSLPAQIKKPEPAPAEVPFTESRQVVVVATKDWNATQGMAHLYERASKTAKWKSKGETFPVVVGRTGLRWARTETPRASQPRLDPFRTEETFKTLDGVPVPGPPFKKEGDGKSPAGMFPLTFAFGTAVKPEQVTFPYTRLGQYTECVDDVNSHHYNKIVGRDQVGIFDWKSSEKMLEIVPQYELGVFVAYNSYPVVKGNGSCIFLHVWKDANTPTAGCTAMGRLDMERIVSWLEPALNPYLVQLPEAEYKSLRKSWNLPKLK